LIKKEKAHRLIVKTQNKNMIKSIKNIFGEYNTKTKRKAVILILLNQKHLLVLK
jgi:hypothetical protein